MIFSLWQEYFSRIWLISPWYNLNMKQGPQIKFHPKINIYKSADAPLDVKNNPFYDVEFWGSAYSPSEVYLPESDVGISFAMAGHEIGHLVKEGVRDDASLDNFEATKAEELRAWEKGFPYLEKYLPDYFKNNNDALIKVRESFKNIRDLMMKATELSRDMYLSENSLEGLNESEQELILIKQRQSFLETRGDEIKKIFSEIKKQKVGQLVDWNTFINLVTNAIRDILVDNENH